MMTASKTIAPQFSATIATSSSNSNKAVPTVAKRGSEARGAYGWELATQSDGAVVATNSKLSTAVTLAPPAWQNEGVSTFISTKPKMWKITPNFIEDMDWGQIGDGNKTIFLGDIPYTFNQTFLPHAAIRDVSEFTPGDAMPHNGPNYTWPTYTMRAYASNLLLPGSQISAAQIPGFPKEFLPATATDFSSASASAITTVSFAPSASSTTSMVPTIGQQGLSKGAIAGIGAGAGALALIILAGAVGLMRKNNKAQRQADIELFAIRRNIVASNSNCDTI